MGDVDSAKGMCVGCAATEEEARGGIREARRRLVRRGTLSLKYPEVFFPRNCRSPSFLGSLNGSGYPGRIEKLPPRSPFLSLFYPSFSLSYFFLSVSPHEAIYTRLRLANSRPLLHDDKAPRVLRPSLHAQPWIFENFLLCPRVKNHNKELLD